MTKKEKTVGEKVDAAVNKISEMGSEIGEKFESWAKETKKAARGFMKWLDNASSEEIITTLLGGVLVVCALWQLRWFVWGILLLLGGIVLINGFCNEFVKSGLDFLAEKLEKKRGKHEKSE